MNRKIRFGLILAAAFGLAGCAAGELRGPLPVVDPTTAATVILVRPYQFGGSAGAPSFLVDGVELGDIGPGEHVAIPISPGEHLIAVWVRVLLATDLRASVRIVAEPGRTYYLVLATDPGGLMLAEVTPAEGEPLVAKTTAVGERYRERELARTPR